MHRKENSLKGSSSANPDEKSGEGHSTSVVVKSESSSIVNNLFDKDSNTASEKDSTPRVGKASKSASEKGTRSAPDKGPSDRSQSTSTSVSSGSHLKEDLAMSIDSTLAKVLSGIKTLDRIQQNPSGVTSKSMENLERSEADEKPPVLTVPIVIKPPSSPHDIQDSSEFPNFTRGKTKASTLPKDLEMKTFGVVDANPSSTDSGQVKDEDAASSTRPYNTLPRSGQMPIPAAIPTVPFATPQPPTPTGTTAPLVPPKPSISRKPHAGGLSPQATRSGNQGDTSKVATLPKK